MYVVVRVYGAIIFACKQTPTTHVVLEKTGRVDVSCFNHFIDCIFTAAGDLYVFSEFQTIFRKFLCLLDI